MPNLMDWAVAVPFLIAFGMGASIGSFLNVCVVSGPDRVAGTAINPFTFMTIYRW
jgi:hypothetical protein